MGTGLDTLLGDKRPAVVESLSEVIDAEVAGQKGLSGAAVKTAYAAAQKVKPNVVGRATDLMLPEFLTALQPFWESLPAGQSFGAHLAANADPAAEALLAVSDAQTADARPALAKVYGSLRGKAKGYVIDALPRVGDAIQAHAN